MNLITKSHYIFTHTQTQVKAGNLGEKYILISEAVVLMKCRWTLFHIPGAAGAATGQMQAAITAASNSSVSPWWTNMCIWAFYRLSGPHCDNSISSCGRQVALMVIIAFHSYVGLYVLGSCDKWHHIHSCTDLAYLEGSVLMQTFAVELRYSGK
jgi:hypothetical protein